MLHTRKIIEKILGCTGLRNLAVGQTTTAVIAREKIRITVGIRYDL